MRCFVLLASYLALGCGAPATLPAGPEPGPAEESSQEPAAGTPSPPVPHPATLAPPLLVSTGSRADSLRALALVSTGRELRDRDADTTEALARFRRALAWFPGTHSARWELGWTLMGMGRYDAAMRAWTRLRSADSFRTQLARYYPIAEMRRDRRAAGPLGNSEGLPVEDLPRDGERLHLSAVGDIQLGQGWRPDGPPRLPPDSARGIFASVATLLADADLTFGNLETALADSGQSAKCRPRSRNCYAFRAPTIYAETLARVGFDILSINNNHAGDYGEAGRRSTTQALDASGILHAGPSSGVATWETKGVRIALVAFSTGEGPYRVPDIDAARRTVLDTDKTSDLVLVSFHGGAEGSAASRIPKAVEMAFGEDRGDVFAFSRAMVDAGADLVLGHGPHVLRGMEVYRGRLIAYSLGNFSAWHGFNLTGPLGTTVVLDVTLAINGVVTDAAIVPIVIDEPGIPRVDATSRAISIVRALSEVDLGDAMFDERGRYSRREHPDQ